jgi:hypothetical protein
LALAEVDSEVERQVWEKFPPSLTISITLAAGITSHKDLQRSVCSGLVFFLSNGIDLWQRAVIA